MAAMHIAVIKSVQNGKVYHSKLLRRSHRDAQGRVQKKTLANLSKLPDDAIDLLRTQTPNTPNTPVSYTHLTLPTKRIV